MNYRGHKIREVCYLTIWATEIIFASIEILTCAAASSVLQGAPKNSNGKKWHQISKRKWHKFRGEKEIHFVWIKAMHRRKWSNDYNTKYYLATLDKNSLQFISNPQMQPVLFQTLNKRNLLWWLNNGAKTIQYRRKRFIRQMPCNYSTTIISVIVWKVLKKIAIDNTPAHLPKLP